MHNKESIYSRCALGIICCLIFIGPMMRGSVHPWAVTIIQMGVLAAAIFLVIEKLVKTEISLPSTSMNKPIALLLLLCILSFAFSDYKPFAFEGVCMLLVYMAAFFITVSSVRTRREQRFLAYTIIFTAVFISIIGILKSTEILTFSWWEYPELIAEHGATAERAKKSLSGPYTNRNHLAGFIEMALPMVLVLFFIKHRTVEEKIFLTLLALFLFTTQVFTLSRGGWISTTGSLVFFFGVLLYGKKTVSKKKIAAIGTGVIIILIFSLANQTVVERVGTLTQQDYASQISGRLRGWKGIVNMIKDNPLLGTGPDTFKQAYPAWQVPGTPVLRRYAHNDYLQFVSELGVLFIPIIIAILFKFFTTGFRTLQNPSRQKRGFALGAMTGIFAILVHSLSDFNLNIPANAFLIIILAAFVLKNRAASI